MSEPATLPEQTPLLDMNLSAPTLTHLEDRVLHLENAVAALSDTQALEDRVLERVTERLQSPSWSESHADKVRAEAP